MDKGTALENGTGLDRPYAPAEIEARWYELWSSRGYFAPAPASEARPDVRPFTVVLPPPNVTGSLTMGHVLNHSLQDVVVRWKRMEGSPTLWVPGMDHAGIATQNVVEALLRKEGRTRHDLGREGFVRRVWEWKEQYGGIILRQMRRLGESVDWSRECFTMDEPRSRAVATVFVRLHEKGLIYRGHYVVNWCPRCLTAISDEEVEHEEAETLLYHIKYPIAGTEKHITVATTRPETLFGDVAVAVNPKDKRYQHLIGKMAILPFVRREIPILADEYVDPKFGTGALKITPAHDANDFEVGRRHGLEPVIVLNPDGTLNAETGDFAGEERFAVRRKIAEMLADRGLLARTETHRYSKATCSRCDTVIEPYLSQQWFVRMKPLAEPALAAAKKGQVKFFPRRWMKVYQHWMTNIRDWCISRQLWWGHRIPVWYCTGPGCGRMIVQVDTPATCPACGGAALKQDEDVLDTWFSSWLWPMSTLGWPEETDDLERFYPTTFLVTGPDIIFFWVARMIMAGIEFKGQVPFAHVLFNGMVRDAQGRKMSKSLGNSPDPIEVMDEYGADAVRFTVVYLAPLGQDVQFEAKRCEVGKFFANKLWNAARLVRMRLGDTDPRTVRESRLRISMADRWILSRYAHCVKDVTRNLKTYRLSEAAQALYQFTWHEYCDWYLEMIKPRWAEGADPEDQLTARVIAWRVLDGILHLLHPFMPFVTEEIWQSIPHTGETIMLSPWPKSKKAWIDTSAEDRIGFLKEVTVAIRNIRSEMNLPPVRTVNVSIRADGDPLHVLRENQAFLGPLARVGEWTLGPSVERPGISASAVVRGVEIFVPLAGLIDVDSERARLGRDLDKAVADLENTKKKLMNQDFLAKARPDVVARERDRLGLLDETAAKLKRALEALRE
ncbi:MAG: valine--tRNA ligase [Candidatus Eiseniibacteriota bacterium]